MDIDAAASELRKRLDWMLEHVVPEDDRAHTPPQNYRTVEYPMSCPACAYAEANGSWPAYMLRNGETHCDGCHRTWASKVEAHCATCHVHFSVDSTAELHDPFCTPEPGVTLRRLRAARRADRTPLVRVRQRKHGPVVVRWRDGEYDAAGVSRGTGK